MPLELQLYRSLDLPAEFLNQKFETAKSSIVQHGGGMKNKDLAVLDLNSPGYLPHEPFSPIMYSLLLI